MTDPSLPSTGIKYDQRIRQYELWAPATQARINTLLEAGWGTSALSA
jgi:hypothetical protein